jgi:hypothetical protein
MSLLHRLVRRLVMRDHIHAVFAYPQDGELVATIEMLPSVNYKGDTSHFESPQQTTIKTRFVKPHALLGLTKLMALVPRAGEARARDEECRRETPRFSG